MDHEEFCELVLRICLTIALAAAVYTLYLLAAR
jgi:hypothetical protein